MALPLPLDLSGNDLVVNSLSIGAAAGQASAKLGVSTATCSSNAATVTKYQAQITSESLSTAGGASQALTITLTGVLATDLAFVQLAGGTNTTKNITLQAVCTANTVTITVYNNTAATALNGTLIINLSIEKS